MSITLTLPNTNEHRHTMLQHWDSVCADPTYADKFGKVETSASGEVLVSPPAAAIHAMRQSNLMAKLRELQGQHSYVELPILTSDGVRSPDVGWLSDRRLRRHDGAEVFQMSPEICVEVLSPCNSEVAMRHKRQLYFDAGAEECWQCDCDGVMSYWHRDQPETQRTQSLLCPTFPSKIDA